MGKINDLFIAEAENYVSGLMAERLPENITFHNSGHTLRIKSHAETIGQHAGLNAEEMNLLRLAALFLNTGYVNSYE